MSEKYTANLEHSQENMEALEAAGAEKRAEIERNLERAAEKSHAEDAETVKHEALEIATRAEKEDEKAEDAADKERNAHLITKKDVDKAYKETLKTVQNQLSAPSRAFSKVIHNPIIEKTSEVAANTVARPNIILAMSISALFSIVIYFIAKTYGYALSGSETLILFAFGWVIGAIIEFVRVGFLNKK